MLYTYRAAILGAVFGTLLTLYVLSSLSHASSVTARAQFEARSERIILALASDFASIAGSLHSIKTFIDVSESTPDQRTINAMSAALAAGNNAIQALHWIPQSNAAQHKSVDLIPIQQSMTALSITPQTEQANLVLNAFERACRRAQQTATAPILMQLNDEQQLAIILIEAIYHGTAPTPVGGSCHDHLKGFITLVVTPAGIVNQITHNLRDVIDSHIYDISSTQEPPPLVYQSAEHSSHPTAGYTYSQTIEGSGRTWLLVFRSMPGYFTSTLSARDWLLLAGLLFLTVMLAHYLLRKKSQQSALNAQLDLYEATQAHNVALVTAILHNSPVGIITISPEGCVETYNTACAEIFGYSADEVLGHNITMLMPPVLRSHHNSYLKNFHSNNRTSLLGGDRGVLIGLRKSGQEIPVQITIAKFEANDNVHLVGSIQNMQNQKNYESQLSEQSAQATRTRIEDANFVHHLCHQIGSQSEDLLTTLHSLQEEAEQPGDQSKRLSLALSQANLLATIARNTLEVAIAYQEGHGEEPAVVVNISQLFDECITLMSPVSAKKGLTITRSVDSILRINVLTDAARLQLLITNILAIVIDLSDRGPVRLDAQLIMQDGESITFRTSVMAKPENIGTALDSQLRDAVSGTPYPLNTEKLSHPGAALAACKNMVEGLQGNIGLTHTAGQEIEIWFIATVRLAEQ